MKILHLIDSLDYGGAETLLMSYIPLLTGYQHVVVCLNGPNRYKADGYEYIELGVRRQGAGYLKAVISIRKLIAKKKIDVVHSHSYWTHIISRLATSKTIKLINHYHFADYDTMRGKRGVKRMIFIDKLTSRKNLTLVAVSEYVAKMLVNTFPKANIKVLFNFIACTPGPNVGHSKAGSGVKVVAVGNCNLEKNYAIVLQAFEVLRKEPVSIDIIGGGEQLNVYREAVKRSGLDKVRFRGMIPNAVNLLADYDLFLAASLSETFGIAVLEAVCAKLPLLLSNIPAFKEIAPKGTLFFDPHSKEDLINNLKYFLTERRNIEEEEYEETLKKYSAANFLIEIENLYKN